MKITFLAALLALLVANTVEAQVGTSPRTLTRRIAPQLPPQRPAYTPPPAAGTAPAAPAEKPIPSAAQAEKEKLIQSAEEKKKLQWQIERAEKGSDNAQYTLGLRYLKGEGVEKDLKKARKWLEASAKQGNPQAKKALEENPKLPPLDPEPTADKPEAKVDPKP